MESIIVWWLYQTDFQIKIELVSEWHTIVQYLQSRYGDEEGTSHHKCVVMGILLTYVLVLNLDTANIESEHILTSWMGSQSDYSVDDSHIQVKLHLFRILY